MALTRAKRWLYVCCPLRYYHRPGALSDAHGYAQLTRFLPGKVQSCFRRSTAMPADDDEADDAPSKLRAKVTSKSIRRRTKDLWS